MKFINDVFFFLFKISGNLVTRDNKQLERTTIYPFFYNNTDEIHNIW